VDLYGVLDCFVIVTGVRKRKRCEKESEFFATEGSGLLAMGKLAFFFRGCFDEEAI
jgi:hypothetical protein